jgi:hypothetical protein
LMSKSSAAVIDPRLLPALHGSAASRLASRLEDNCNFLDSFQGVL